MCSAFLQHVDCTYLQNGCSEFKKIACSAFLQNEGSAGFQNAGIVLKPNGKSAFTQYVGSAYLKNVDCIMTKYCQSVLVLHVFPNCCYMLWGKVHIWDACINRI